MAGPTSRRSSGPPRRHRAHRREGRSTGGGLGGHALPPRGAQPRAQGGGGARGGEMAAPRLPGAAPTGACSPAGRRADRGLQRGQNPATPPPGPPSPARRSAPCESFSTPLPSLCPPRTSPAPSGAVSPPSVVAAWRRCRPSWSAPASASHELASARGQRCSRLDAELGAFAEAERLHRAHPLRSDRAIARMISRGPMRRRAVTRSKMNRKTASNGDPGRT